MTLCLTKPLSYGEWCFDWVAYFSFKKAVNWALKFISTIPNRCLPDSDKKLVHLHIMSNLIILEISKEMKFTLKPPV